MFRVLKALGREFSFLERNKDSTKEEFAAYMKSNLEKGYPVIALGIIGPPEPCIVAGYEPDEDIVMGWNFFQNDPEFASNIKTMDNGYFCCKDWWENTDTHAVMCIGGLSGVPCSDKEILKMAADIMEAREEGAYAKGIKAYGAWKDMLLDETWFSGGAAFDCLFSRLLVQNDAMACVSDGRRQAAKYFEELSETCGKKEKEICKSIANHFNETCNLAEKMQSTIGGWDDTEKMLQNFGSRSVREKLGSIIDSARLQDERALQMIKELYCCM